MRFSLKKNLLILAVAAVCVLLFAEAGAAKSFEVKTLRSGKPGADYIAIAPKVFHDELKPLLEQREADGMRVVLVEPKDIYEEFGRWPVGPKAIRAFLRFAYENWQGPAPKYVLLCGDFNILDDYDADGPMVPTFMVALGELLEDGDEDDIYYVASDAPYADMDGDEAPDISIGRIPADAPGDLKIVVDKILKYENEPVPGPWRRRVSAFASTGNFGIFDSTLEELTRRITKNNFNPAFDLNMTYGGSNLPYFALPDEFDKKVVQRFNEGALFMEYIGHGSGTGLSRVCFDGKCKDILEVEGVPEIDSAGKNTFFFSICCLTGKFNVPTDSIAEALLKNPNGPVGVFAASEVSGPYPNAILSKDIMYFLVARRPETIGEGVRNLHQGLVKRFDPDRKFLDKQYTLISSKEEIEKQTYDHIYLYNYIGDPATKIQYPADGLKITAPENAAAGETITAKFKSGVPGKAKLLVTLEINPTEYLYDVRSIQDLEGAELEAQITQNYANANNKVAVEINTELDENGEAEVEITVPETVPGGEYYVKGYAWDGIPDAMGMARMNVASDVPPIQMVEPEEKETEPVIDILAREIKRVKELDVSGLMPDGDADKNKEEDTGKDKKGKNDRRHRRSENMRPEETMMKPHPKARLEMLELRFEDDPLDAEGAVALASAYRDAGKPDKTVAMLKRAEVLGAGPELNIDISDLYAELRQYEDAVAALRRTIAVKQDDDKKENEGRYATVCSAYDRLADLLITVGNKDEAVAVAKERSEYSGNDLDGVKALINVYTKMDGLSLWYKYRYSMPSHMPELAAAYEEAEKLASSGDRIHGDIFLFRKNWVKDPAGAEKKAREIIRSASMPYWKEYITRLATMLMEKDEPAVGEAFELMWKYHKLSGNEFPKARAVSSFITLLDLAGSALSEKYVDLALKVSPKCATCNLVYWQAQTTALQEKLCSRALEIDPDLNAANRCLAEAFYKKEDYKTSSEYFDKSHTVDRDPLPLIEVLAAYKADRKRHAMDLLGGAREFDRNYSADRELNIAVNRMMILAELEEYGMAEDVYLAYVKENKREPLIHHFMAKVYAQQEEWNLAAQHEKFGVSHDPYCLECLQGLGEYSAKAGQWRDAENAFRAAAALSPGDGGTLADLAEAMLENGKKDEARRTLYEAMNAPGGSWKAERVMLKFVDPSYFFD